MAKTELIIPKLSPDHQALIDSKIKFHNDMAEYWNSPVFKIINHLKRDKSQRDRKERDERRMKEIEKERNRNPLAEAGLWKE